MKLSKIIPLCLLFAVAAWMFFFIEMGSFATDKDMQMVSNMRSETYDESGYKLSRISDEKLPVKVGQKRQDVLESLNHLGFKPVYERTTSSVFGKARSNEDLGLSYLLMGKEVSGNEVVIGLIFRNERYLGKLKLGLANSPKQYIYERI